MTPWAEDEAARAVHAAVARFARERLAEHVLAWDAAPETRPAEVMAGLAALGVLPLAAGDGAELGVLAAALDALAEVDAGIALAVLVHGLAGRAAGRGGLALPAGELVGLGLGGSAGVLVAGAPPGGAMLVLTDGGGRLVRRAAAPGPRTWALGCRTAPLEWCEEASLEERADAPRLAQDLVAGWLRPRLEAGVATIALAVARAALAAARTYAEGRYQGGVVIAQHAAVQALLAESARRLEAAVLALGPALAAGGAGRASLACEAATAAAEANASDGVQVHGGYGYMHDYGAEKRLRDAKTLAVLLAAPPAA